jgi:hypothetical protein
LNSAISRLSTTLDTQGTSLISALQSNAGNITDTIAQVGSHTADILSGTADRLQSETLVTLQKMSDASHIVRTLVEQANQSIGELESKLADRVIGLAHAGTVIKEDAAHSASLLLEQIESMREVTATGIHETRALIDVLDERTRAVSSVTREHVEILENAAQSLGSIEGRLGSDLENRKASIEVLTRTLNEHFNNVETVAEKFALHLNGALMAIENRAGSIRDIMSDAATVASQTMREQFDTVRAEADAEKERTVDQVRAVSTEALAEMSELLGQLVGRFEKTAADVKSLTESIAQEVDAAREDITKSVTILPNETKEQSAALKRAVSEQIRALGELNAIMAASSRVTDTAKPVEQRPAPVAPEKSPERSFTPVQRPAAPIEAPRSPMIARPDVVARDTVQPAKPKIEDKPYVPPVMPQARPEPVATTARPTPAQTPSRDPRSGWLSDLLDRASQDEVKTTPAQRQEAPRVQPTPAPVSAPVEKTRPIMPPVASTPVSTPTEPIAQLLADVRSLMNDDAVSALWAAYLRGENVSFSRSLYTLGGQRRFAELSALYQSDEKFRTSLNSYANRFEAVLKDLTVTDADGAITRSILSSPEGRVYTMLAHVSNRLG